MADNTAYWWEKSLSAVNTLSTGDAPLRVRLQDAWDGSLMRMQFHDKVADELKEKFLAIERRFRGNFDHLSGMELRTLASDVVSLFVAVEKSRT
jgi:hypothetical protein